MKYIFITKEYTICTGISNITHGIELKLRDLVLNKKALDVLGLVSIMCDTDKPERTFKWYCSYLAQFAMKECEDRERFNLTNPTVQVLCSGELLKNLKLCF